jgi:aminopeptidase N
VLLEAVESGETGVDAMLQEAVGALLELAVAAPDDGEAKALLAAMLTPPSEDYLGQQLEVVAVDAIHRAREGARAALARHFADRFRALHAANAGSGPYRPDAAGFARRGLRNLALHYLVHSGEAEDVRRAVAQYEAADNMTDRLSALRAVVWSDEPAARDEAPRLLDDFLARFRDEALVVDQWFTTQALATAPGTLERVRELTRHEAFDARNPNKIRALVGAFCGQNPVCFHAADGSGYAFLADWVLALDRSNPQIAARLLTPLTRWKRHDADRSAAMRAALQRILDEGAESPDVYEVVTKSLEA